MTTFKRQYYIDDQLIDTLGEDGAKELLRKRVSEEFMHEIEKYVDFEFNVSPKYGDGFKVITKLKLMDGELT